MWTWVYIADTCVKVGTGGSSHGPAVGVKHHARRLEALEGISTSDPAVITSHNWVSKIRDVEISLRVFFGSSRWILRRESSLRLQAVDFPHFDVPCDSWPCRMKKIKLTTCGWGDIISSLPRDELLGCWDGESAVEEGLHPWRLLGFVKLDSKGSYNGSKWSRCQVKISDIYRHNIQCARESVLETKADRQNSKRFAISQAAGSRWPSCHSSLCLREVHDWYDHTNGTGEDTFFFSCLDCLGLHWNVWNEVISTNVINHKCWQQMQAKPSSVRWPALFEPRWGVQSTVLYTSLSRWWNRYDWIPIDMTNTI